MAVCFTFTLILMGLVDKVLDCLSIVAFSEHGVVLMKSPYEAESERIAVGLSYFKICSVGSIGTAVDLKSTIPKGYLSSNLRHCVI